MRTKTLILFLVFVILVIVNLMFWFIYAKSDKVTNNLYIKNQKVNSIYDVTLNLKDTIKSKKLIFRFSILNCSTCIDSALISLRKVEKRIGIKNIVVLAHFQELRHFAILARSRKLNYEVFFLPTNELKIKNDSKYKPLFFIINERFNVENFTYVPDHNITDSLDNYFNRIYNEYFKSQLP